MLYENGLGADTFHGKKSARITGLNALQNSDLNKSIYRIEFVLNALETWAEDYSVQIKGPGNLMPSF